MNFLDWLFWNVDTQFDFVSPHGKLYVPGAELLKLQWAKLTQLAKTRSINVVNTADWHYPNSAELSSSPDFIKSFPQHCMANTAGAEFIEETNPENPLIIDWDKEIRISKEFMDPSKNHNYIIRKDAFDVFRGNRYTEEILNLLSPKIVIVYGVTTNVCVNDAVIGLAKRVKKVIVIENAIKELPKIPLPFENWKKIGVELMHLEEVHSLLNNEI
ncbi:MAG TPA: isochorismatase family cysteine hydrolase [Draconibacterium sp.]|nr:isochorismatase family cysteine hydrolase [Draconibacterium sp.]